MTEFEKVIMTRDNVDREEAKNQRKAAMEELAEMLEFGCSYSEVEEMMLYDYGLEMDYIMDLI